MRAWLRLVRFPILVQSVLGYGLGFSIAIYRNLPVSIPATMLGLAVLFGIQLGAYAMLDFFAHQDPDLRVHQRIHILGGERVEIGQPLVRLIQIGLAGLGMAAIAASFLIRMDALNLVSAAVLGISGIAAFAYSVPPLRSADSAYKEVFVAIVLAGAAPAFGLSLQVNAVDPLLPAIAGSLTFVLLACQLALGLEQYRLDGAVSGLLGQVGWRTGMRVHDLSMLLGFGVLLSGLLIGMPRRVVLGGLLALPLALAQMWMLFRIRSGVPPAWGIQRASSYAVAGLLTYLMAAGFLLA